MSDTSVFMEYHSLHGLVENDLISQFCNILREGGHHTVYFTTDGGRVDLVNALVHIITDYNKRDNCSVRIIFFEYAFSAGFWLMFQLPAKYVAVIPKFLMGMSHRSMVSVQMNTSGSPSRSMEDALHAQIKDIGKQDVAFMKKIGLTAEELKRYKDGEDVFFLEDRMVELCNLNGIEVL